MANNMQWTYASEVTLESSGASCTAASFAAASSKAPMSSGDNLDYPLADFSLTVTMTGAVANATVINLYRQDHNITGTTDSVAPQAGYLYLYVGSFLLLSGSSGSTTYTLPSVPLRRDCQFYIENKAATHIAAGWTLKCIPKTYTPSA